MNTRLALLALVAAGCAGASGAPDTSAATPQARLVAPESAETRISNIRQLTFGGQNAEAYWSADGTRISFQSTPDSTYGCDQIFVMNADGSGKRRVSNGQGKTTCAYFYDNDRRVLFASTHGAGSHCPPGPDFTQGYVWPLDDYDIWTARPDGSDLQRLTNSPGYDAEATLSPDGRTIVFTSVQGGDLDIYTMNTDGSNLRRLTTEPGYDGGPFFSHDGRSIVYRADHPQTEEALADYRRLLAQGKVRPSRMELWIMNADGSNRRQITRLGGANFAPYFTPDDRAIIFSSNHLNPRGRNFDLFLVNVDGTGLQRVTTHHDFDGFPMFSPDGRKLVFASNRSGSVPGETNIFVADWRP